MLATKSSSAIVGVSDLERAGRFYGHLLGLARLDDGQRSVLVFRTGATLLIVDPSAEAGTNRANAVVWGCGWTATSTWPAPRGRCGSRIPTATCCTGTTCAGPHWRP